MTNDYFANQTEQGGCVGRWEKVTWFRARLFHLASKTEAERRLRKRYGRTVKVATDPAVGPHSYLKLVK